MLCATSVPGLRLAIGPASPTWQRIWGVGSIMYLPNVIRFTPELRVVLFLLPAPYRDPTDGLRLLGCAVPKYAYWRPQNAGTGELLRKGGCADGKQINLGLLRISPIGLMACTQPYQKGISRLKSVVESVRNETAQHRGVGYLMSENRTCGSGSQIPKTEGH